MGASKREQHYLHEKYRQSVPAGVNYDPKPEITKTSSRKAGFGFGERNLLAGRTFSPGPGTYDARDVVEQMKSSKGFSVQGKTDDPNDVVKRKQFVPGPGQYDEEAFNRLNNSKGFALDKEQKKPSYINYREVSPPPGSYTPTEEGVNKFKKQGGPRFGTEKRPDLSKGKDAGPGPGSYKVRSTFTSDVPKYLI